MRPRVFQDGECGLIEAKKVTRCPYMRCSPVDGTHACVAYTDGYGDNINMPLREGTRQKALHGVDWKLERCTQCLAEVQYD